MINKILKIYFIFCCGKTSIAQVDNLIQKSNKNSIQIDFGYVHNRLIDEGFTKSKLLFRGTNPKLGLSLEHQSSKYNVIFVLSANPGNISLKQIELESEFANISASIEYLRKIKTSKVQSKQFQWYAGLQLNSTNYAIINENIFDNIDVFSFHGTYLKFQYLATIDDKKSLKISYAIPAVVYANQVLWNSGASTYNFNDKRNIFKLIGSHGEFHYFDITNNIPIEIVYQKKLSKNVDFIAKYSFRYLNYNVESPFSLYSNELLFGLKFNL